MRVLVTGSEGYLGTVMCGVLSEAGDDVAGAGQRIGHRGNVGPEPTRPPMVLVDLRDVTTLDHLRGFDAVAHLAALSNDPPGNFAPEVTYDINHAASSRRGQLALDGVRRFLYPSTCSVTGPPAVRNSSARTPACTGHAVRDHRSPGRR